MYSIGSASDRGTKRAPETSLTKLAAESFPAPLKDPKISFYPTIIFFDCLNLIDNIEELETYLKEMVERNEDLVHLCQEFAQVLLQLKSSNRWSSILKIAPLFLRIVHISDDPNVIRELENFRLLLAEACVVEDQLIEECDLIQFGKRDFTAAESEVLFQFVNKLEEKKLYLQSLRLLEQIKGIDPKFLYKLVLLLKKNEMYEKCIEPIEQLLLIYPSSPNFYSLCASLFGKIGDYEKAWFCAKNIEILGPMHVIHSSLVKGIILLEQEKYDEALVYLNQILELGCKQAVIFRLFVRARLRKNEDILQDDRIWTQFDPTDRSLLERVGRIEYVNHLKLVGKTEEAFQQALRALKKDHENRETLTTAYKCILEFYEFVRKNKDVQARAQSLGSLAVMLEKLESVTKSPISEDLIKDWLHPDNTFHVQVRLLYIHTCFELTRWKEAFGIEAASLEEKAQTALHDLLNVFPNNSEALSLRNRYFRLHSSF